ncbi:MULTISPECIES: nuclear transport factor 2 family protein [Actinomycetes]|uniref:nuclear transport factor 2 family protein n=1 Tax=Actinomycetes TaxID=1760 RepID=UPI0004BFF44A|nr:MULTISPECIES: nuclear transport factor 2 family protein [Actinomycetes]
MQTSTRAHNIALIENVYGLLQAFELGAFEELVHPNFTIDAPASLPYGGLTTGMDEMKSRMSSFGQYWDDPSFGLHAITANDDGLVTAHVTLRAVGKTTGEPLEMEVVEVWTIHNGKVAGQKTFYFDPAEARRVAGVTSDSGI